MLGVEQVIHLIWNNDGWHGKNRRSPGLDPCISEVPRSGVVGYPRVLLRVLLHIQAVRNFNRADLQVIRILLSVNAIFQDSQSPAGTGINDRGTWRIPSATVSCRAFSVEIGILCAADPGDTHLCKDSVLYLVQNNFDRTKTLRGPDH